jgi:hypothetical protein
MIFNFQFLVPTPLLALTGAGSAPPPTGAMLTENSDFILTESGSFVLLE